MKAPVTAQHRLLDLQQLDTTVRQLHRQRETLPALATVAELTERHQNAADHLVRAQTARSDVQRELARAEADVQLVRDRAARDQGHLDSGTGSAKQLQALQHELASLARRQSELEDIEIEVMERAERADEVVAEADNALAVVADELGAAQRARDEGLTDVDARLAEASAPREALAAQIPADLLALYERLRTSHGGTGAAMLHARRCLGCQLELNAADIGRIRAAEADEVIRCEECSRILIRTAESGL